jgi:hypothetical protein
MLYLELPIFLFKNRHAGLKLHQDAKYKRKSTILSAFAILDKRTNNWLEESTSDVSLA